MHDRQISFGVNYQQTSLHSAQTFPQKQTVDKTFRNFLPNARIQYTISDRSSLRLMYRASTNLPSVTQLQNVVNVTVAPFLTAGNPDLEQQYMPFLSTQYTYTNTAKGILVAANVFAQKADNYVINATFVPTQNPVIHNKIVLERGQQLSIPMNLDGYSNLRSFVTVAVPLKFIKSTFNLNGGVGYAKLPGITNNMNSLTQNYTYTLGSVLASNISEYVDFTISYAANFNQVRSNIEPQQPNDFFSHVAGLQLSLLNKEGWFFQNDVINQLYDFGENLNTNYFLWNMSAGKKSAQGSEG